jgi:hypothetical protein
LIRSCPDVPLPSILQAPARPIPESAEGSPLRHLLFALAVVATSTIFALLEIQIEGVSGWAGALPTWRVRNAWTRRVLGARDVTGYHVYCQLFVMVMAHLPYLLGAAPPGGATELRILAFLVFFWILEDYLWFVFNPAFGPRRFRRDAAPWHAATWWAFMPRDYWLFLPIGAVLYFLSWRVG